MKKFFPLLLLLLVLIAESCKKNKSIIEPTPEPVEEPGNIVISGISPAFGAEGTEVTISGSGFGNNAEALTLTFGSVAGEIKSVSATKIVAIVPSGQTAPVMLLNKKLNSMVNGPLFSYLEPAAAAALNTPYVSGSVNLSSPDMINAFALANKGRQLEIVGDCNIYAVNASLANFPEIKSVTGGLVINASDTDLQFLKPLTSAGNIYLAGLTVTNIELDNLKNFSGNLTIYSMAKLNSVRIAGLSTALGAVNISYCPSLSDLSFLKHTNTAASLTISQLGVESVTMDELSAVNGSVTITSNTNLNQVSFKGLKSVTGDLVAEYSMKLTRFDYPALSSVSGKVRLRTINITDMNGMNALQQIGSLSITNCPALVSLNGLEKLTVFAEATVLPGDYFSDLSRRLGGLYLSANVSLASIDALKGLKNLSVAYINGNTVLNDLCPLKYVLKPLVQKPDIFFTYKAISGLNTMKTNNVKTVKVAALTLGNNGSRKTQQDGVDGLAACP
ncbi:MAG: IPT/TIG domain-containing protein [Bacteroidota bacterium]